MTDEGRLSAVNIPVGGAQRPLYYRPGSSDESVIKQIFENKDYHLGRVRRSPELVEYYQNILADGKVPLVVDAGANIGVATVFFLAHLPLIRVVAIEPEPSNFSLLERNVQNLNVNAIQGAVASSPGFATIIDPQEGNWGFRTERATDPQEGGATVRCVTINDIFEHQRNCVPLIVKIDIEGGENELFSTCTEWIDRVPLIIIELHDWLLCGQASSRNFLKCVGERERDFVVHGENIFSISNHLLRPR
jgi:FkbM family methyltransferase